MDLIINFDKIIELMDLPADVLMAKFFLYVGWIPIAFVLIWGFYQLWIDYRQSVFISKREYMLLAIDIPRGNEQSPKAVEQMFAHLAGAHKTINLIEKYWRGVTQDYFSLETVSIEGYTQFLIRTERKYRDLIEAMVYAQYPDAEITEVNDYVTELPDKFPDDTYDIWGGEWIQVKDDAYPFRTYIDFEHQFTGEFKDPSAALMELFNNIGKGEQCWYQIIVTPTSTEWEAMGDKEISKVVGEEVKSERNIVDKITDGFLSLLTSFSELIYPLWGEITEKEKEEEMPFKMFALKPAQRKAIDAIQMKVSKLGFEVKIRFIYVAEKEVFNKTRGNSFVGVMKQYGMQDLNALKPDMAVTVTSAHYVLKESRLNTKKNRIMRAYKSRSNWLGRNRFILNIEELATLWHFPIEEAVKAPMLQKVPSRKTEAPSYLPVEAVTTEMPGEILGGEERGEREEIFVAESKPTDAATGPPPNLPII